MSPPPTVRFASTTSEPFVSSSTSHTSYYAVPPPASLNSSAPRRKSRKGESHFIANSSSPPSTSHITVGLPTLPLTDTLLRNPMDPSVSPAVLAETPRIIRPFSPDIEISTGSPISYLVRAPDYSLEYMQQLRSFIASKTALEETGYILQPLSQSAIERKKRCERCGKGESV